MARRAHELDTVELLRRVDGRPRGTIGVVVSEHADAALVEVVTDADVDADGLPARDLLDDLVSVPYSALHVVEPAASSATA